jgi:hypothetical protein
MLFPSPGWGGRNLQGAASRQVLWQRPPAVSRTDYVLNFASQDLHGSTTDLPTCRTLYNTVVKIMPVEASGASSKTIAALFAIPVVILFLSIWLAVTCSECWNKSDNRVKKYLEHKGRALSSERSVDEEAHA